MGNIGTRTDDLCMYVQTNQPYYSPHALVDGAVYIDVFRPVVAYRLDLKLKGVERVKWEELKSPSPGTDANKVTEKLKDKKEIFRYEVPLYQVNGNLNVGQYQFPFAFQLPDRIPGSFDIKHLDHEGRVKYNLIAALVSDRKDPIKHKSELVVRQQPTIANYNSPVTSEQGVCVCCISKGRCKLECSFQSDAYQPGQQAVLMCRADNRACNVGIKNFSVSLIQRITFRTKAGKETGFTRYINSQDFPGIPAGAENLASPQLMTLALEDPLANSKPSEATKPVLQPNVHGQLIDCRYDLEVRPVFDAPCSCCSNVPVASIPLYIYAAPLMNWVSSVPQGFRPTVFEVNQIILPIPSLKVEASLPNVMSIGMPSISAGVSLGGHTSVTVNPPAPHVDISMPIVHATLPVADVRMNVGGAHMRIDVPAPTMETHVTVTDSSHQAVQARFDMPGLEGMNMTVKTEGTMNTSDANAQVKFTF